MGLNEKQDSVFPFLLGGTFIEAEDEFVSVAQKLGNFPSFWEGLSLRQQGMSCTALFSVFPFLLGGTFIEALVGIGLSTHLRQISLPFGRDFH